MPNILLVEDDELMINLYSNLFSSKGYSILVSKNGEECLQAIDKNKIDLILLDIMMPKMDGLVVLKNLREQEKYKKLPIIVLSNLGNDDIVSQAFSLGATQYFVKSDVDNDKLVAAIEEELKNMQK
jgi:CheY-like chemotaxis protein